MDPVDLFIAEHSARLRNREVSNRIDAAQHLGATKDDRAVQPLITAFEREELASVRQTITEGLITIGSEAAFVGIVFALDDDDASVRRVAYGPLGKARLTGQVKPLITAMTLGGPQARRAAVGTLGNYADHGCRGHFPDPAAGWDSPEWLDALRSLHTALGDDHPAVREEAAKSLGRLADGTAEPALLPLLDDEHHRVRSEAARALGKLKAERAAPRLLSLLNDDDSSVRSSAALALGSIRHAEAFTPICALLGEKNWFVVASALCALGLLGEQRALPVLLPFLKSKRAQERCSGAEAIALLGDPTQTSALLPLLRDADWEVRQAAVHALWNLRSPAALPALRARLRPIFGERLPWIKELIRYAISSIEKAAGAAHHIDAD